MIDDAAVWLGIVVSHQDRADALSSISCSARIDGKRGRGQEDDSARAAAAAAAVVAGGGRSNGRAVVARPGAGAGRRQAAVRTTLNVACWSSPYAKLLTDYVPQFEEATGAKATYETPSFPIYNQRTDVE